MDRREANDRVPESERRFATLIDNLPGVAYRCRNAPDWPMEFISDAVLTLTGYAAKEFLRPGVGFGSLVHAEDRAGVWEEVQVATAERKPYRLEYRLKTATGEEKWVWEQGRGVYGPSGELEALEGFITDITEQKRNEGELRSQASTIRALMESVPEAIVAIDHEGRIVLANPALERIFGFRAEEAVGQSVEMLVPERLREAHAGHRADFFSQPRQRPMGATLELVGRRKDGSEFPIQVSLGYIKRPEVLLAVAFISDITEQKRAEDALKRSEERYRSLVENSPDCIHEIDLSGRLISMNRAGLCMVEAADQKEIEGRSYLDLAAEQDRERVGHLLQRALGGEGSSFESAGAGAAGRFFSSIFVPIRNAEGSIARVMGISSDITDRKHAEEALRESEKRFRVLAESTRAVPWEAEAESGRFTYVGPQAVAVLGYSIEEWYEPSFWPDHIVPEDREKAIRCCTDLMTRQDRYEFEYRMLAADGRVVWIQDLVSVLREKGQPQKLRGFLIDITERIHARKKLEQREAELQESQKRLRRLAGDLISAHEEASTRIARELHDDFGQRLASVVMQSSVLERRLSADESAKQRLQRITKSIGELADDCQKLSRRMHSSILEKVGLEAALKAECESFAEQVGIEVGCEAEAASGELELQAALCLYRVAQEALRNVARHAEASRVEVTLAPEAAGVTLRIRDDGVGFDVASALKSRGLGLTSMEERVRPFGGRVSLLSEMGKGTTVEVYLPVGDNDDETRKDSPG